jgi:cell division protein FtsB
MADPTRAALAERLRERAEGCEFATDLSLMHQAADALDRLAAERVALNAAAADLVTALAECNVARKRAEAIADAAREDTALLNAGQSLMNCADFDYGERHEAILCLTIPKGVGVSGDLRQFLRAALLAAVGKGAQDG